MPCPDMASRCWACGEEYRYPRTTVPTARRPTKMGRPEPGIRSVMRKNNPNPAFFQDPHSSDARKRNFSQKAGSGMVARNRMGASSCINALVGSTHRPSAHDDLRNIREFGSPGRARSAAQAAIAGQGQEEFSETAAGKAFSLLAFTVSSLGQGEDGTSPWCGGRNPGGAKNRSRSR